MNDTASVTKAAAVTDATFADEVLNSPVPVLVDFWADWCPPCRALGPTIDALASEAGDRFKVLKLDVDANKETSGKFEITSIPTVLLFVGGEVVEKLVGVKSKSDFEEVLARHTK